MVQKYESYFPLTHSKFGIHVRVNVIDLVRHSSVMAYSLFSDHPVYVYKYYRVEVLNTFFFRKVVTMPSELYLDLFLVEYGSVLSDQFRWVNPSYF